MSLIKGNHGGLGGAGAPGGALGSFYSHTLDQSLRFNDDDGPNLTITYGDSGTSTALGTFSWWMKLGNVPSKSQEIIYFEAGGFGGIQLRSGQLAVNSFDSSNTQVIVLSDHLLRDPSAWYHCVVSISGTAGTIKFYINGEETPQTVTVGSLASNRSWDLLGYDSRTSFEISDSSSTYAFDGYLTEFHYIDGQAYDASYFGETKDGVWIPKAYSGSYGDNGFYLPFAHDKTSEGFTPVLYEGTRVADTKVQGVGFTPDLVWVKRRDGTQEGSITDSVRGVNAQLRPAATNVESSQTDALTSFNSDGFTLGADASNRSYNYYQDSHVAWCWEAGGAPTATNSAGAGATPTSGSVKIDGSNLGSALAGTIPATKLTANTTKGFSIVSYTGTGSNGTIAHGLSSAPEMIITKNRDDSGNWMVYHANIASDAETDYINLNLTNAAADGASVWNDTAPTSSVFSVGTNGNSNGSSDDIIAYCWHSVSGYSKFGSYTGSGSSGKAVTGLGFRPVFVMVKRTDSSGGWHVFDSVRFPSNPIDKRLEWDNGDAENSDATVDIDFDSDGFTLKTSFDNMNASSGEYIFMAFADTRDSAFYKDNSGNLNNFTPTNVFTPDVVPDSPTNNFATMNPIYHSALKATLSDGNLKVDTAGFNSNANNYGAVSTFAIPKDKKIYVEVVCTDGVGSNWYAGFATQSGLESGTSSTNVGGASAVILYNRAVFKNGTQFQYSSSSGLGGLGGGTNPLQAGDILGMAVDGSNGNVWFSKNGSYFKTIASNNGSTGNVGDPSANSDPVATIDNVPAEDLFVVIGGNTSVSSIFVNFGQDSQNVSSAQSDGESIGTFEYAPPTGYVALCSSNLTDSTIGPGQSSQANEHFDTVLYTGNGNSSKRTDIAYDSLVPDWVWIKQRSSTQDHALHDTVRGSNKKLESNNADAEVSGSGFGTDGLGGASNNGTTELRIFTASHEYNASSATYVAWGWKAGGAPTATNTETSGAMTSGSVFIDGSSTSFTPDSGTTIYPEKISANRVAGFSIVLYQGNDATSAKVPHGLSSAPELIIIKNRSEAITGPSWPVGHIGVASDPWTDYLDLSTTTSVLDAQTVWYDTAPTSTLVSLGTADSVNSGSEHIMYCFHSVPGYLKVGSFVGNGSTTGPFIHTGFRPAWFLVRRSSAASNWTIFDNKRGPFNEIVNSIDANLSNAEETGTSVNDVDFVSNGIKIREDNGDLNASGGTIIYIAFAEAPFKFANAR